MGLPSDGADVTTPLVIELQVVLIESVLHAKKDDALSREVR